MAEWELPCAHGEQQACLFEEADVWLSTGSGLLLLVWARVWGGVGIGIVWGRGRGVGREHRELGEGLGEGLEQGEGVLGLGGGDGGDDIKYGYAMWWGLGQIMIRYDMKGGTYIGSLNLLIHNGSIEPELKPSRNADTSPFGKAAT